MISLSLAKKLKNAGLQGKREVGDIYWIEDWLGWMVVSSGNQLTDEDVWMPHLHQLLDEIEKHGYEWSLHSSTSTYDIELYKSGNVFSCIIKSDDKPEDAAGQALLWILEQEE